MNYNDYPDTLAIKCDKCEKEIPYTGYFFQKSFTVIDKIIQDLTQQLLKHYQKIHSTPGNQLQQEIYALSQLLKNSQNQERELKQKWTSRINSEFTSPAVKKEWQENLTILEQHSQETRTYLQSKLTQKQGQSNSTDRDNQFSTNTSPISNQSNFNWLYVIIPMGAIVLLLGVVIFQNRKK